MNQYPPTPDPQWPPQEPQQPATNPSWQPAPPSFAGQPQYGAPTPTPAPGAPYGQYGQYAPPSQYPQQPTPPGAQPYGQYGPPSQYPGQPYGQYAQPSQYPGQTYGQYAPPSQYPQAPYPGGQPPMYAPQSSNGQRKTLLAVGAGIILIAVIAFLVVRGNGGASSLTGTWIGPATISATASGANTTIQAAVKFVLTESGSGQVTGTATACDQPGTSGNDATVNGTRSDSSVNMTISGVAYTGHISGGHLTLQASQGGATVSFDLHQGSDSDYQSLCNGLPTPTS